MGTVVAKISKKVAKQLDSQESLSKALSEAVEKNGGFVCPGCAKPWPKKSKVEPKEAMGFYVANSDDLKGLHSPSAFINAVLMKKFGICCVCSN